MLYPRTIILNGKEVLVNGEQLTGFREHLTREHRIVFLHGLITGTFEVHDIIMALNSISHDPIKLMITSPGGELDSAFLLYNTMKLIKSPIYTIGRYCASAAAIILAAGSKRYLYPDAKIMLHLPAGQMTGDAKDFDIQHRQMGMYRKKVVDILLKCGATKTYDEILSDIDRDFWLEPKEAIEYGLADEILTPEIWEGLCQ